MQDGQPCVRLKLAPLSPSSHLDSKLWVLKGHRVKSQVHPPVIQSLRPLQGRTRNGFKQGLALDTDCCSLYCAQAGPAAAMQGSSIESEQ